MTTFTTDPNRNYPEFNGTVPEMFHRSAGTGKDVEFYLNLTLPPFLLSGDEKTWAGRVAQYVAENRITPPAVTISNKGSIKISNPTKIEELAFSLRRLDNMPATDETLVHYVTHEVGEVLGTNPIQFYNGRSQEVLVELPGPGQVRHGASNHELKKRLRLVYMRQRKEHPHMMVRFEHNDAVFFLDRCYHRKKEVMLDQIWSAHLEAIYRFRSPVDWHDKAENKEAV